MIADSGEAPAYAGVSNESPFLNELMQKGVTRYGVNFISEKSPIGSGDAGGFSPIKGREGDDHPGAAEPDQSVIGAPAGPVSM